MAALKGVNVTQASANAIWSLTHNLGTKNVAVDAIMLNGGNDEKVMPLSIVATDDNTVTITFSAPQSGQARIVGGTGS